MYMKSSFPKQNLQTWLWHCKLIFKIGAYHIHRKELLMCFCITSFLIKLTNKSRLHTCKVCQTTAYPVYYSLCSCCYARLLQAKAASNH